MWEERRIGVALSLIPCYQPLIACPEIRMPLRPNVGISFRLQLHECETPRGSNSELAAGKRPAVRKSATRREVSADPWDLGQPSALALLAGP